VLELLDETGATLLDGTGATLLEETGATLLDVTGATLLLEEDALLTETRELEEACCEIALELN